MPETYKLDRLILVNQPNARVTFVLAGFLNCGWIPGPMNRPHQINTGLPGLLLLSQDTLELCEKFGKTVMWNFAPARDLDKSYLAKEALFLINNRKPIK